MLRWIPSLFDFFSVRKGFKRPVIFCYVDLAKKALRKFQSRSMLKTRIQIVNLSEEALRNVHCPISQGNCGCWISKKSFELSSDMTVSVSPVCALQVTQKQLIVWSCLSAFRIAYILVYMSWSACVHTLPRKNVYNRAARWRSKKVHSEVNRKKEKT